LTEDEIKIGLASMATEKEKLVANLDERVQQIFFQLDSNNSGKIDYTEFIMACLE
jgi:calcium-dependent protein kinase